MPASDYTSTVSGGLKLKGGAKDGGIKKKKKSSSSGSKKKSESEDKKSAIEPTTGEEGSEPAAAGESSTALARQPQIDEDDAEEALESRSRSRSGSAVPANIAGSGKTEDQRRHEEIKRKRVSENIHLLQLSRRRGDNGEKPFCRIVPMY